MGAGGVWNLLTAPIASLVNTPQNSHISIISLIDGAKTLSALLLFFFFPQDCFSLVRQAICLKWMWLSDAGVSFCIFYFFFLFCSAHLGLLVFGTMIKRDGDKTWLPSI